MAQDNKKDLRNLAEARLHSHMDGRPEDWNQQLGDLVHELEVHQIELELQNEELQRTQARLQDALARYQDLFELAPVGYVILHANGAIINANLTATTLLGVNRLQLTHGRLQHFVVPEYQDILHHHLNRVFNESDRDTCELEILRDRSERFFARLESTVQYMGEAQEPECLTAITDVTENQHREETLRKSQGQLRQFIEQAPISIAMLSREMRYIAVSDRWIKEYGRGRTNLTGLSHYEVHPDLPGAWKKMHRDALAGAFVSKKEELWIQNDGSRRWLRWAVHPWTDEAGEIGGIIISLEDITERKQAEQALLEADRRKDEFLAILAHELRNPMTPIRNAVHLLKRKDSSDRMLQTARDIIDRQSQHLARLVDDLMDVSRITQRRLELRTERVELQTILEHAIEASMPMLDCAAHEFTTSLPADSIYLDADPVRLAQLFVNLLNNACKYTPDAGHIDLAAGRDGADVVVTVRDTGQGILAEHMPHIFEMFSRAESASQYVQSGVGIGLWLARSLAEMHDGSIEARSEGLGKGSEFIVRLPAAAETPVLPQVEQDSRTCAEPGKTRRILVVDDNQDIVDSMVLLLELDGYQVKTAHDGLEALELVASYRPEVILLDIGIPELDGYTVCRRIRNQPWGKDIRIFAITGWGQENDRQRSDEAGFDGHLVKPLDPPVLLQLLAELPT